MFLENELISRLAEKIVQARKLYGSDSSYVIGLITGFEWVMEGVDGGAKSKGLLHNRILEFESGKPVRTGGESGTGVAGGETLAENTWIKGIVKWFNNDKGYGFISTESHIDVFVHWRDISSWDRSLTQGDEVEFMVTRTAKGFQAINVMKVGQEEQERREEEGAVPTDTDSGIAGGAEEQAGSPPSSTEEGGGAEAAEERPPAEESPGHTDQML